MDDGDGSFTMELQAGQIAQNTMHYNGSRPCPTCGVVLNPVAFAYNGMCINCKDAQNTARINSRMA
jgi:hypothetical protein